MIKNLGIPKEVKQDEGRVALIPEHITQFTGLADIFVETQAGVGSGFTDEDYKPVSYTHLTLPTICSV